MPRYTLDIHRSVSLSPMLWYQPLGLLPSAPNETERRPGVFLGAASSAEGETAPMTAAAATIAVTTGVERRVTSHRLMPPVRVQPRIMVLENRPGCSRTQCPRLPRRKNMFRLTDIVDQRWSLLELGNLPGCSWRRCLLLPTAEEANRDIVQSGPFINPKRSSRRACWRSDTSSCSCSWKPCIR